MIRSLGNRIFQPWVRFLHHASFLRWLVAYLEGGFYMDLDHLLLRPLEPMRNLFAVPVERVGVPNYGYELVDGKAATFLSISN